MYNRGGNIVTFDPTIYNDYNIICSNLRVAEGFIEFCYVFVEPLIVIWARVVKEESIEKWSINLEPREKRE